MRSQMLKFDGRERDTLIAALRYWQRYGNKGGEPEDAIAENGRNGGDAALSNDEIDTLIETRINV